MAKFSNWAATASCAPTRIADPATEDEVRALVSEATAANQRVKVVGSAHSWSDVAMTDAILVRLDKLDRVLAIDDGVAIIEGGIKLRDLVERLAERGVALPITGSILAQSLAGATAVGTHGSSLRHGNLASGIVGMRLVIASGDVLDLDEHDPRLLGAACGLGALGVVTQIRLRVVPLFRLRETQESAPFDVAVDRLVDVMRDNEFAKLWWLPHTDRAQIFRYERTDEAETVSLRARSFDERVVNRYAFAAMLAAGAAFPSMIPAFNRLVSAIYFRDRVLVGRYDRVLTVPMPPTHREAEWSIPAEHAAEALRWLRDWLLTSRARVDFIVEARFVKADRLWMSPASGRDSCALGAYAAGGPDRAIYYAAMAEKMRTFGGRPHWGKEHDATIDDVAAWYPDAARFRGLMHDLDPTGTFRNAFVERVFDVSGQR